MPGDAGGLSRRQLLCRGGQVAALAGLAASGTACGRGSRSGVGTSAGSLPATAPPEPAPTPSPAVEVERPPDHGTLRQRPDARLDPAGARLRVLGIGIESIDSIRHAAERELGIEIAPEVTNPVALIDRVIRDPGSFDVLASYQSVYDAIWASGSLAPIELSQVTAWDSVSDLFRSGKLDPASPLCTYGDGDAPFRTLYVDPDRSGAWRTSSDSLARNRGLIVEWVDEQTGTTTGAEPSFVAGVPFAYSLDSVGYDGDVIDRDPEEVSWGELFNESFSGRVALLGESGPGLQDAGNAARSLGLLEIGSLGDMTRPELDALLQILDVLKRKGHFREFLTTVDQSIALMASGEVVVASMPSQAVALLASQGLNARYAAPPEGYRAWAACLSISAGVRDERTRSAALAYVNWWLSGEPGAIMMRQGYYSPVQGASRAFASAEEWAYWIDGQPAATDLAGVTDSVGDVRAGSRRDGGSLLARACNIGCWNSYFAEDAYQRLRWQELLAG